MIGVAIPISIVGTFLMITLLGRNINVISLAGMSFAIGMVVDSSIVVLENIFRHYQEGESSLNAALHGTQEVIGAIVASTLTTIAVFVPVVFVEEEAGAALSGYCHCNRQRSIFESFCLLLGDPFHVCNDHDERPRQCKE